MGAIEKALSEVRFAIPFEILNEAFKIDNAPYISGRGSGAKVSLEARLREEIIENQVLVDCNLMGGHEIVVPLEGLNVRYHNDRTFVVTIPKRLTEGLPITSVLSVAQAPDGWMGSVHPGYDNASAYSNQMDALFRGATNGANNVSIIDGRVRLIGENTVYVKLIDEFIGDLFLRCRVGSDSNMSKLPPTAWLQFADMVILATKAHIYNKLSIVMDEGQLSGGLNLGRFKETVDEYRDAHQMYREFIMNEWPRIAALNDEERHTRAIQFQFGRF